MIYFIFDNPLDKEKMSFLYMYDTKNIIQKFPQYKIDSLRKMFCFLKTIMSETKKDDVLIFWYDFMGIFFWWLCKIYFAKRNIVILNILLKDKKSIKNRVAKVLYKKVLHDTNVISTVTSGEYGKWINNVLKVEKEHVLLHDIYYGDAEEEEVVQTEYTIFCGGRNGRDWEMFAQITKQIPNIDFVCVMPQKEYEKYKFVFGANVKTFFDVGERVFCDLIKQSAMVIMPLDTEAPAGLISIFQAASYHKLIITSDTVTTREYVTDNRGVRCNSINDWCENILYFLEHSDDAKALASNLCIFLNAECSKEIYSRKLLEIVSKFFV